ncbi:hypothetical protein [Amycolatopsis sp. CA-128772]|uniref:hypothetical protein n=1 Tax=Amycolatopsis sp. CA-128772 TaxID=2073159 RepID=UPI001E50EA68|nr:hypothetical protein [Amycolatopsis sp. CA-128772]
MVLKPEAGTELFGRPAAEFPSGELICDLDRCGLTRESSSDAGHRATPECF